jgi:hypothetical protein
MSEKPELSSMTERQKAWTRQALEAASNQASFDLAGWTALEKIASFDQVFMRRVREKRLAIEKRMLEGVLEEDYSGLVIQRYLLLEIESLPVNDKAAAFKHLHPNNNQPYDEMQENP